jgi:dTDP-4-amino-4,6-dideoxy-D-galactose acyltransferase
MNPAELSIERLEWDSDFFGFGVGRIPAKRLTSSEAAECARQARALDLRCVYFLADPGDPDTWRAAIEAGFDPVDIRVELALDRLPNGRPASNCVLAGPNDLTATVGLARGAFEASRFFRDRRFPAGKAEELFSIWTESGIIRADGFTVLLRLDEGPAGFASARVSSGDSGRIELVAVSPAARGRGVGLQLLDACLAELSRRGVARVSVVTQGSNDAAQRLYERAGFRTRSLGIWFHGWF